MRKFFLHFFTVYSFQHKAVLAICPEIILYLVMLQTWNCKLVTGMTIGARACNFSLHFTRWWCCRNKDTYIRIFILHRSPKITDMTQCIPTALHLCYRFAIRLLAFTLIRPNGKRNMPSILPSDTFFTLDLKCSTCVILHPSNPCGSLRARSNA